MTMLSLRNPRSNVPKASTRKRTNKDITCESYSSPENGTIKKKQHSKHSSLEQSTVSFSEKSKRGRNLHHEKKEKIQSKIRLVYPSVAHKSQQILQEVPVFEKIHKIIECNELMESDTEEINVNRIGNISLEAYKDQQHIGYDIHQKKLSKPVAPEDCLKTFFSTASEDKEAWRIIEDPKNQTFHKISDADLLVANKLLAGTFPVEGYGMTDPEASTVEFENHEEKLHPLKEPYPPKRRFTPSTYEQKEIVRIYRLLKKGLVSFGPQIPKPVELTDLWGDSLYHEDLQKFTDMMRSSLRPKPPTHYESYNPSDKYLLTPEEEMLWLEADADDRILEFLPTRYATLRHVKSYTGLLLERFKRCLDLYLCPRGIKKRMNVDPASLLPKIPEISSFQPFPSKLRATYRSDLNEDMKSAPLSLAFDSTGNLLAVGQKNGFVNIYDTRYSLLCVSFDPRPHLPDPFVDADHNPITSVAFSPSCPILAISCGKYLFAIIMKKYFSFFVDIYKKNPKKWSSSYAQQLLNITTCNFLKNNWSKIENDELVGWRITNNANISQIAWHRHGFYLVTVASSATSPSDQLTLHALRQQKSLSPINAIFSGKIQSAHFHPVKNQLIIGSTKSIRVYNLDQGPDSESAPKKNLVGKFSGFDHLSCMGIHPNGELIAIGGHNRRVTWFDTDFGEKPFKILRCHQSSVTNIGFHSKYPLTYSTSQSGDVNLFWVKDGNFSDSDQINFPTLYPIRSLQAASLINSDSDYDMNAVLSAAWHPTQPWLAIGLASGNVGLFVN